MKKTSLAIIIGVILVVSFSAFGILLQGIDTEITKETISEPQEIIQEITHEPITQDITNQNNPIKLVTTELGLSALGEEYASQIISNCYNDLDCALNSLRFLEKNTNSETVLSTFTNLIELFDIDDIECHETAHHLGAFLYPYVGQNISKAFEYAGQKCGGAIYHGVIMNYFLIQVYEGIDPTAISVTDICSEAKYPYDIDRWQCLHGIGHGLAVGYDYDVFSAVKRCDVFEPGWEQISCSKGIFMQNNVKYMESGGGNFDENNIMYPCDEMDSKYVIPCYHYHTTYIIQQNEGNLNNSFADCDSIEPKDLVRYCYHGMGRQTLSATGAEMSKMNQFCQVGEIEQYHPDCFRGMVMTLINNDRDPSEGFIFCQNIPYSSKTDCYDALGKWILMLYPNLEQRKTACSSAENLEYAQICIDASLDSIKLL